MRGLFPNSDFWACLRRAFALAAVAGLFCASVHAAGPTSHLLPPLKTDQEKLQFLLYAREKIPGLFEEAARYDVSLLKLLEDQQRLQEILSKNPEYLKALRERPPLLRIEVSPKKSLLVQERRIKASVIQQWRDELRHALRSVQNESRRGVTAALDAKIKAALETSNSGELKGLINSLINFIPPRDRRRVFEVSEHGERIERLKTLLPERLPQTFKGDAWGIPAGAPRSEAIRALEAILEREEGFGALLELRVLMENPGWKDMSHPEILRMIDEVGEADLIALKDKDYVGPRLQPSFQSGRLPSGSEEALRSRLSDRVKRKSSVTEAFASLVGESLILEEVPPSIGIFRGCAGGDCSTQMSFAYPNAPAERTFLIREKSGSAKGYLTGATVRIGDETSFRVITIAGPRVGSGETQLILNALEQAKTSLGVRSISFPVKEALPSLINFTPIRETITRYIAGKPIKEVHYRDSEFRKPIESFDSRFNIASYDKMDLNRAAVEMLVPVSERMDIELAVSESSVAIGDLAKPIARNDVIGFALDLHHSNRSLDLKKVLSLSGIEEVKFNKAAQALKNESALPVAAFEEQAKAAIQRLGGDPGLFESRGFALLIGRLHAPDSLSPAQASETVKQLVDMLRIHGAEADFRLFNFIATHASALRESKEFRRFFGALASAKDESSLSLLTSLIRGEQRVWSKPDGNLMFENFIRVWHEVSPWRALDTGILDAILRHESLDGGQWQKLETLLNANGGPSSPGNFHARSLASELFKANPDVFVDRFGSKAFSWLKIPAVEETNLMGPFGYRQEVRHPVMRNIMSELKKGRPLKSWQVTYLVEVFNHPSAIDLLRFYLSETESIEPKKRLIEFAYRFDRKLFLRVYDLSVWQPGNDAAARQALIELLNADPKFRHGAIQAITTASKDLDAPGVKVWAFPWDLKNPIDAAVLKRALLNPEIDEYELRSTAENVFERFAMERPDELRRLFPDLVDKVDLSPFPKFRYSPPEPREPPYWTFNGPDEPLFRKVRDLPFAKLSTKEKKRLEGLLSFPLGMSKSRQDGLYEFLIDRGGSYRDLAEARLSALGPNDSPQLLDRLAASSELSVVRESAQKLNGGITAKRCLGVLVPELESQDR